MRNRLALAFIAISILAGFSSFPGLFCRYNVRETGFVDLGVERYALYCYVGKDTPPEVISSIKGIADEVLLDTSVRLEIVDVDRQKDHPGLKHLDTTKVGSYPVAVLVSPHEVSRVISIETPGVAFAHSVRYAMQEIIDSPIRDRLVRQLARNYAVVLLIEGTDAEANTKARQAIRSAFEDIKSQMDYMPKPISRGPVLLALEADAIASEKILMWSFGLNGESPEEPLAAVIYGRARWIGPVLSGREIAEDILFNILSIVGADCECGLDPRLIRGTVLPIKWSKEVQALVSKELAFDPENPMVKLEVSQILRMRASLYPYAWMNPDRTVPTVDELDDLPIPFVEDMPPETIRDSRSPVSGNLLIIFGSLAVLVLFIGAAILLRASRSRA